MALFCGATALVSVGISCQTAMQLEQNEAWIGDFLGGTPEFKTTPFDWLICGPSAACKMIEQRQFFPPSTAELDFHQRSGARMARWSGRDCYYWHEAKAAADPDLARAKFEHLASNFDAVRKFRRRIFIFSNTQNNLSEVAAETGLDIMLTDTLLDELRAVLTREFGSSELYAVSYADRNTVATPSNKLALFNIRPDASNVLGDSEEWRKVFSDILRRESN